MRPTAGFRPVLLWNLMLPGSLYNEYNPSVGLVQLKMTIPAYSVDAVTVATAQPRSS